MAGVGAATEQERPDVALVAVGPSPARARVDRANRSRVHLPRDRAPLSRGPRLCPRGGPAGVYAYVVDASPEELQSTIDLTLRRFTEYQDLQGAFGRRTVIAQAKGF